MNGPFEALNAENSSIVGVGLTMEGINQNYIVYELMLDTPLYDAPQNLNQWVS